MSVGSDQNRDCKNIISQFLSQERIMERRGKAGGQKVTGKIFKLFVTINTISQTKVSATMFCRNAARKYFLKSVSVHICGLMC